MTVILTSAGASHRGCHRTDNQDAFLERHDIGLWAVADGMGGLAHGARASQAIVQALTGLKPGAGLADRVGACLAKVNDDLHWDATMTDGGRMMGSTVVILLVTGDRFLCLWAGDSRLYRWRRGSLLRVTSDHTPIQGLLDAGLVRDEQALRGLDHVVTRAVGTQVGLDLDRIEGVMETGDIYLLCTDGLSKVVDEGAIASLLVSDGPARAVDRLIAAALAAGGPDNVTALVVSEPAPVPVETDTVDAMLDIPPPARVVPLLGQSRSRVPLSTPSGVSILGWQPRLPSISAPVSQFIRMFLKEID